MLNYAKTYRSQGQKALAVTSLALGTGKSPIGKMLAEQNKDGGPMGAARMGFADLSKSISGSVANGDPR